MKVNHYKAENLGQFTFDKALLYRQGIKCLGGYCHKLARYWLIIW